MSFTCTDIVLGWSCRYSGGFVLSFLSVIYSLEEAELQGFSAGCPKRSVNSLIFTPSLTPQKGICFPQTAPLTDNFQMFVFVIAINV